MAACLTPPIGLAVAVASMVTVYAASFATAGGGSSHGWLLQRLGARRFATVVVPAAATLAAMGSFMIISQTFGRDRSAR